MRTGIGTYTDRLYVEFNAVDGIPYYDQLFWKASAYGPGNGYGGGR
ncbi:hypothetical protein [Xanthomonas arboricola]|nr:hypothetical protein [Xanthomonas arboricola]